MSRKFTARCLSFWGIFGVELFHNGQIRCFSACGPCCLRPSGHLFAAPSPDKYPIPAVHRGKKMGPAEALTDTCGDLMAFAAGSFDAEDCTGHADGRCTGREACSNRTSLPASLCREACQKPCVRTVWRISEKRSASGRQPAAIRRPRLSSIRFPVGHARALHRRHLLPADPLSVPAASQSGF